MSNLRFAQRAAFAFCCSALSMAGWAQSYPSKPVRIVVPYSAGGVVDLLARTLAPTLGETLGVPIVVEDRPGVGGTVGSEFASRASPDGYTLLLASSSSHSIPLALGRKLPYDPVRDFTPIVHLGSVPSIMLVPAGTPAKTLREWIDYARQKNGELNYASGGSGTIVWLVTELLKAQTGVAMTHVAYKGTTPAVVELMAGNVDLVFDALPTGLPHVRDGRLRALGVTSRHRSPLAPEVPPIADTLPGFEANAWFGLYGPRALPADVVARVNQAANRALADPRLRDKLQHLGVDLAGGTPQQLSRTMVEDTAKWKKIVGDRPLPHD